MYDIKSASIVEMVHNLSDEQLWRDVFSQRVLVCTIKQQMVYNNKVYEPGDKVILDSLSNQGTGNVIKAYIIPYDEYMNMSPSTALERSWQDNLITVTLADFKQYYKVEAELSEQTERLMRRVYAERSKFNDQQKEIENIHFPSTTKSLIFAGITGFAILAIFISLTCSAPLALILIEAILAIIPVPFIVLYCKEDISDTKKCQELHQKLYEQYMQKCIDSFGACDECTINLKDLYKIYKGTETNNANNVVCEVSTDFGEKLHI